MNIFCISDDPKLAAWWLCEKHATKMILETTQLISNVYHFTGQQERITDIYKKSYFNHPSSKWARQNTANFAWLLMHLGALVDNYDSHLSNGSKEKYLRVRHILDSILENEPPNLPRAEFSQAPFLAFGSEDKKLDLHFKKLQSFYGIWNPKLEVWESKTWDNGVAAYRAYYCAKQFKNDKFPEWKKCLDKKPDWYSFKSILEFDYAC
jgi:hypothetical protein